MSFRYAIAISYSSDDHAKVRPVVKQLCGRLGRSLVFFDENSHADFVGAGGGDKLRSIFGRESAFVVPFFSTTYTKKDWCDWEWQSIRELLDIDERRDTVLPVEIENVAPMGWKLPDIAYRPHGWNPEAIAKYILSVFKQRVDLESFSFSGEESEEDGDAEKKWNDTQRVASVLFRDTVNSIEPKGLREKVLKMIGIAPNAPDWKLEFQHCLDFFTEDSPSRERDSLKAATRMRSLVRRQSGETREKLRHVQRMLLRKAFAGAHFRDLIAQLERREPISINVFASNIGPRIALDLIGGLVPAHGQISETDRGLGFQNEIVFCDPPLGDSSKEVLADSLVLSFLESAVVRLGLKIGRNENSEVAKPYADKLNQLIEETIWDIEGESMLDHTSGEFETPLFFCLIPVHDSRWERKDWLEVQAKLHVLMPRLAIFIADSAHSSWSNELENLEERLKRFFEVEVLEE